jgi:hypothetical protein
VVVAIERYSPSMQVWQAGDGALTVGVDRSPAEMSTLFRRFPQDRARLADEYEFYLAVDKSSGTAKLVEYFRRKGAQEPPPWEVIGGKSIDWVEVKKITTTSSPLATRLGTLLAHRVWKTPTKVELRTAVGFNNNAATPTASTGAWPPPRTQVGTK